VSIGRKYRTRGIALAATASTALAGLTLVPGSAAADPKPTLPEARAKVADLQHKAEIAGEAANDLRDDIAGARRRLTAISSGVAKQQRQVDAIREQIGALAVAGYQQSGMSTTAQLLLSENPDQFLDQASTAQAFAGQQNAALRRFQSAQGKLTDLQAAEQTELAALQSVQAKQNGLKKQLDKHLEDAEKVLGRLSDEERDRLEAEEDAEEEKARRDRPSRSDRDDDGDYPGSGRGVVALNYALDQIGDPYSWGADGPSSFDCSGLTQAAWAKAGVSLSHSSKAQTNEGRSVSKGNLRPGDLVFYYSPVSHVGLYAGDGNIVHAPRPGKSVRIADLDSMPYSGAVRPG
jgi:cell wall-associated NlpC family hydrolase